MKPYQASIYDSMGNKSTKKELPPGAFDIVELMEDSVFDENELKTWYKEFMKVFLIDVYGKSSCSI